MMMTMMITVYNNYLYINEVNIKHALNIIYTSLEYLYFVESILSLRCIINITVFYAYV